MIWAHREEGSRRTDENAMEFEVEGSRMRGRPRKRWRDVVESDQQKRGLRSGDALNRRRWRRET